MSLISKIKPAFWDEPKSPEDFHTRLFDYRAMWKLAVIGMSSIAILPFIVMFLINQYEHKKVLREEMLRPIVHFVSNSQRSMTTLLSRQKSALHFIAKNHLTPVFADQKSLEEILADLKGSFSEFVGLGLYDSNGKLWTHAGPAGRDPNFTDTGWHERVDQNTVYTSEMFSGFDGSSHFTIAVKFRQGTEGPNILRASIKAAVLENLTRPLQPIPFSDTFITNREGVLQTPSRLYGKAFEKVSIPFPSASAVSNISESQDKSGRPIFLGSAIVEDTPFRFVTVVPRDVFMERLFSARSRFLALLVGSMFCVLLVIAGVVTLLVGRIYEADRKRAAALQNIQYTNKMATIGRLSAGVAHEINNPLAIIYEKAGLLKDLITMKKEFPRRKVLKTMDSILSSAQRCADVTHSLLGFASHIDVRFETIDLEKVIKEVLLFVGKESEYRSISVEVTVPEDLPPIRSDVGQLEQVLLNIINNAFESVEDGGKIHIELYGEDTDMVGVRITDDGHGISEGNLKHIFDPFFSTKEEKGSGLGLSVTYGIVQKLGGTLDVKSKKGEGSVFAVSLPTGIGLAKE